MASAPSIIDVRTVGEQVRAAAAGDRGAWEALVARHTGLLWSIARGFRMPASDASDAIQTSWLRLFEHLDRIDDPERVTAWLATTVRRECLRVLSAKHRTVLAGEDDYLLEVIDDSRDPSDRLVADEEAAVVRRAMDQLPDRWRELMEALMADPAPSYEEISKNLQIPIGSIGPTRGRCLQRLKVLVEADGIC
jgi:RNA polymerase sigma factor (sigma-70 family)